MEKTTKQQGEAARFRQDIRSLLRRRVREAIEITLEEELAEALGCGRYERSGERRGYRNGSQRRTITTAYGVKELELPRGRLIHEDGSSEEFHSEIVPRYARRSQEVDEAILGAYLAGANSRRIRKALAPLLGQEHLSKSAVSRVVSRLKQHFARWSERDLSEERYAIVYLDGFHLKVRLARRVVSAPVLAVSGIAEDGCKVLVSLRLAVSEAGVHWRAAINDLKKRGLIAPRVIVSDGHKGLAKSGSVWPEAEVQRCTQHKWANLKQHCPAHARAELKRDWDAIVYADDGLAARAAYRAFVEKWAKLVPAVVRSLEEAGLELLTFYALPKSMWRSLRTTNALSRCRPPGDTDRTRNDGNPDAAPRARPPKGLDLDTRKAPYSMPWGHHPRPAGGGRVSSDRVAPVGLFHSPRHTTSLALTRDDDAELTDSKSAARKPLCRASQPPLTWRC